MDMRIIEKEDARFYIHKNTVEDLIVEEIYGDDYTRNFQVEPGETWYDFGANIGAFSVYAAMRGAKVYAYEPVPQNYETLLMNLAMNNVTHMVTPMRVAVVDRDSELVNIWLRKENTGGCSLYFESCEGQIQVPALSIRSIELEEGCCIKMDVEGAEVELLPAIEWSKVNKLAMEYHHSFFKESVFPEIKALIIEQLPHWDTHYYGYGCAMEYAWR